MRAENLAPGAVRDPWSYAPSDLAAGTRFTWRDATLGACDIDDDASTWTAPNATLPESVCSPSAPPVCGVTETSSHRGTSACDVRNWIANDAGATGTSTATYSTDLADCARLCAVLTATHDDYPGGTVYAVQDYATAHRADAEVFLPWGEDPAIHLVERQLYETACSEVAFDDCDAAAPPVVFESLDCIEYSNVCEMKTAIASWASAAPDTGGYAGFYRLGTCGD